MWTGFPGASGGTKAEYEELLLRERVRDTSRAFEEIARHLERVPGRKSLVWITGSFPLIVMKGPVVVMGFNPEMEAAARALNNAHVALYAVDSRGLMASYSGSSLGTLGKIAESDDCKPPGCVPQNSLAPPAPLVSTQ